MMGGVQGSIAVYSLLLAFSVGGAGSIMFPNIAIKYSCFSDVGYIDYRDPITITKLIGLG